MALRSSARQTKTFSPFPSRPSQRRQSTPIGRSLSCITTLGFNSRLIITLCKCCRRKRGCLVFSSVPTCASHSGAEATRSPVSEDTRSVKSRNLYTILIVMYTHNTTITDSSPPTKVNDFDFWIILLLYCYHLHIKQ